MKVSAPELKRQAVRRVGACIAAGGLLLAACGGGGTSPLGLNSIGGSIHGLASDGLIVSNGTDRRSVSANAIAFTLPTSLAEGSAYAVTITTQPLGERCTVADGSGAVGTAPVTSITITCSPLQWSWVGGGTGVDTPALYGTLSVADAANQPGGRRDAVTWTDASGDLWLFGGEGGFSGGNGYPNDLWKYSPASAQWTWVAGGAGAATPGVYGTRGIAAASSVPGGRHWSSGWTDGSGRLWLFGGIGYDAAGAWGLLNDLWSFDPASGRWTWWTGSTSTYALSIHGAAGVGDLANTPGARDNSLAWLDNSGNVWLYGGFGDEPTGQARGALDELWMYSPASGEWTWQAGSAQPNTLATYGTQDTASPNNSPGGRYSGTAWRDATGTFWLFGGFSYYGLLNDLWMLNPSTLTWTWVSGSNQPSAANSYGTLGVAAASNAPGARSQPLAWSDSNGDLWLFGGYGYDATFVLEKYNDLWVFRPSLGRWSWIAGDATPNSGGIYGTMGTTATGNSPGARLGAAGWRDTSGRLWVYGGGGYATGTTQGYLGDLWRFGTP
ncbi:MAG: kelch repeat-containing protein [Pseudomonadota bacterium]